MAFRISQRDRQGILRQLGNTTGEFFLNLIPNLNLAANVTFSVGAEATNAIPVTIQVLDQNGNNLARRTSFRFYLSSDAAGLTPAVLTSAAAVTTGGIVDAATNGGVAVTTAAGLVVLSLTDTGTPTRYVNVVLPSGEVLISPALTWA
jgi:hypothetical protein